MSEVSRSKRLLTAVSLGAAIALGASGCASEEKAPHQVQQEHPTPDQARKALAGRYLSCTIGKVINHGLTKRSYGVEPRDSIDVSLELQDTAIAKKYMRENVHTKPTSNLDQSEGQTNLLIANKDGKTVGRGYPILELDKTNHPEDFGTITNMEPTLHLLPWHSYPDGWGIEIGVKTKVTGRLETDTSVTTVGVTACGVLEKVDDKWAVKDASSDSPPEVTTYYGDTPIPE